MIPENQENKKDLINLIMQTEDNVPKIKFSEGIFQIN